MAQSVTAEPRGEHKNTRVHAPGRDRTRPPRGTEKDEKVKESGGGGRRGGEGWEREKCFEGERATGRRRRTGRKRTSERGGRRVNEGKRGPRSCKGTAAPSKFMLGHGGVCTCKKIGGKEGGRVDDEGAEKRATRRTEQKRTKLISEALTNYFLRKGVGYLRLNPFPAASPRRPSNTLPRAPSFVSRPTPAVELSVENVYYMTEYTNEEKSKSASTPARPSPADVSRLLTFMEMIVRCSNCFQGSAFTRR